MWSTVYKRLFSSFLHRFIQTGGLVVTYPDGDTERYGDIGGSEPVSLSIKDNRTLRHIMLHHSLGFGEAYMDGRLTVGGDDLYGALALMIQNHNIANHKMYSAPIRFLRRSLRWFEQFNTIFRARQNVAHHYDLSDRLYALFLDEGRQYSCAYFAEPGISLEEAQDAKKKLIAKKLLLNEPGLRVLDIGCGWGGLSQHICQHHHSKVLGITLSQEQFNYATHKAQETSLDAGNNGADTGSSVEFRLLDYRKLQGQFDRIVSVGMFEHVGMPHYKTFFKKVRRLLADDGVALLHTIGRTTGPATCDPWIAKYIFPGGYIPSLSEVMPAIEKSGLVTTDVEILRLHYADTLKAWRERFIANQAEIRTIYDERFCRMWLYYLIASELSFRLGDLVVFQIQLAKNQEAVPLTRDYLYGQSDVGCRTSEAKATDSPATQAGNLEQALSFNNARSKAKAKAFASDVRRQTSDASHRDA